MQVFIRKGGSRLLSKMGLTCASHSTISFRILPQKRSCRRLQGQMTFMREGMIRTASGTVRAPQTPKILCQSLSRDRWLILSSSHYEYRRFSGNFLTMASLVRSSITRRFRIVARRNIVLAGKPVVTSFIRLNSSEAPPPTKKPKTPEELQKKAALERHDDLQRDWDAKIITYEDLVPITESPTPVHIPCTHEFHDFALTSFTGHLSYWCSWAEWGRPRNDSVCC